MKIHRDKRTGISELQAMRMADRYGLVESYKYGRRHGQSIASALDEWDLLDNNFIQFTNQYNKKNKNQLYK